MQKILLVCIGLLHSAQADYFTVHKLAEGITTNQTEIRYHTQESKQEVGFVSYTKIPCMPFYVLHSLYVYPSYRRKGYGRKLIEYTLQTLKELGGSKVYIQPGPFELNNNETTPITDTEKEQKLKILIDLYTSVGFVSTWSIVSGLAFWLYTLLGIHEDSAYLMVKIL